MNALVAILLGGALVPSTQTVAHTSSPLLGRWAVDVSRLPMPAEARPKSVTFTFSEADGRWVTHVDIRGGDGSEREMTSKCALDGSACPIQGDTVEADTAAVKMPAPNVMVMALGKRGNPASTRIYTVSADGKTMTETAVYFGPDGKPVLRTNRFNRTK